MDVDMTNDVSVGEFCIWHVDGGLSITYQFEANPDENTAVILEA